MLLGFKRQFAPYVEEGSKTHTVRGLRKNLPRVGEVCHCYVDPRQKTMRLLGRFECTGVQAIVISETGIQWAPLTVKIDGVPLTVDEANAFFHRDGFREEWGETYTYMHQAAAFWKGKEFPFEGHLIHWSFEPGTAVPRG